MTVFMKEMLDILRDKRALFLSIGLPMLLFPLGFGAANLNLKSNVKLLEKDMKIVIKGDAAQLRPFLGTQKKIIIINSDQPEKALSSGEISSIVECSQRRGGTSSGRELDVLIIVDNLSQRSIFASTMLAGMIEKYNEALTAGRGQPPFIIRQKMLTDDKIGAGKMLLATLIPILLFAFSAIAPMAIASDLVAGEKERATLDPLLCLPVSRFEILLGKCITIVVMGVTGVISFMTGIAIAYFSSPDIFGASNATLVITPLSTVLIILCGCILVMLFGTIELVVSIFSRSTREAQILLVPVIMIAMGCGYSTVMIDLRHIGEIYRIIPIVSFGVSIKEIAAGFYEWKYIALSLSECVLFIGLFFYIAFKLFSREKIILRS
jgi:sodium transport system permease protein